MAVRVEPLRGRPSSKGPSTYPGLTPEERGVEPLAPPEILPEPPLWVLPSGMPLERRPTGFVPPLPPPLGIDLQPPEGLFDVPGLLERLWLARALEAHHERTAPVPLAAPDPPDPRATAPLTPSRSGGAPPGVAAAPSRVPPPATERHPVLGGLIPPPRHAEPLATPPVRPRSWVCPHCYLTNDAAASTCRGCRSSSLHF